VTSAQRPERRQINEYYTRGEEIANGVTHGIGAGLAVVGLVGLVVLAARNGDAWQVVSASIYGACLVLLFLASTLYHSIQNPRVRPILRRVDHAAIYLLIAGTYTPFTLISLRGPSGWTLFGVVWGLALAGVLFKVFFINRLHLVSTLAYVAMGWLCVFFFGQMLAQVPPNGVFWLVAGGVCYTLGVIFYIVRRIPYGHAIWHLFVLGGALCHFFSVRTLIGPL
jgi:hemolysin III